MGVLYPTGKSDAAALAVAFLLEVGGGGPLRENGLSAGKVELIEAAGVLVLPISYLLSCSILFYPLLSLGSRWDSMDMIGSGSKNMKSFFRYDSRVPSLAPFYFPNLERTSTVEGLDSRAITVRLAAISSILSWLNRI